MPLKATREPVNPSLGSPDVLCTEEVCYWPSFLAGLTCIEGLLCIQIGRLLLDFGDD